MKLPFFKQKPTEPDEWSHLLTTQLKDQSTSLLFLNQKGEFKTITLDGAIENDMAHYIKSFEETGLSSVTFEKNDQKYLIFKYPNAGQNQAATVPAKAVAPQPETSQ